MDSSQVVWRKSSYSTNGADCVEVGAWRKSSHSTQNGDCIEVGLRRKRSHSSGQSGECVEVAGLAPQIAVRDSKDPDGTKLVFSGRTWGAFTGGLRSGF